MRARTGLALTMASIATAALVTTRAQEPSNGVLLVGVGVHVEPVGLSNGRILTGKNSYADEQLFRRHAGYLRSLASIVERHGGRLTVQVQSPFIDYAAVYDNVVQELAARGHEIALHFHEDAHLGRNADAQAPTRWTEAVNGQIAKIQALGVERVRMWSGANLYSHLLEVSKSVGLDVKADWKNPKTQTADVRFNVTTPWRPAGSPTEEDLTTFLRHDPRGALVFLPSGVMDPYSMHDEEIKASVDPPRALQAYWTDGLSVSLGSAGQNPLATHVFHLTLHPGELQQNNLGGDATLDDWLTDEIDPLLFAGKVKWATFSQMADTYAGGAPASAVAAPSAVAVDGRSTATTTAATAAATTPALNGPGYITFALNIHDWTHPDESADTVLRAIDLFARYAVRGDFYLTGPMAEFYARSRPEVITRLRDSGMTVSYHVRAPHPLYAGFGSRLEELDDAALEEALLEYETFKLDLATGDLVRGEPGGYALVAGLFGSPPVTVVTPSDNAPIRQAAQRVYASLGARALVVYHESGTKPDEPFEWRGDLLVRPSDFSITRWSTGSGAELFWWNMLGSRQAAQYDPVAYLQQRLAAWNNGRPPLITSLIHENNFVRSGAEGWTLAYYTDTSKTTPHLPPFDLDAADPSTLRSSTDRERIWAQYERLVAWAASNLQVVTSADLVALAGGSSYSAWLQNRRPHGSRSGRQETVRFKGSTAQKSNE